MPDKALGAVPLGFVEGKLEFSCTQFSYVSRVLHHHLLLVCIVLVQ